MVAQSLEPTARTGPLLYDMRLRFFRIAEEAACGLVTSDCKSTSTAFAHLYRLSDSSPRTGDDGELTEQGALAAEADAIVRYSTLHMARLQADRRRLLSETEGYG